MIGSVRKVWTEEEIKKGFDKFIRENGRLPTAPEVDGLKYLPSSRQIQRRFGGLQKLRQLLGYKDFHFGKGSYRATIASNSNISGLAAEKIVEEILIERFGEPFVHVEKRYGDGKNRLDFYVYNATENFGIDVVSSVSFRDLQKNVNMKIPRYLSFNGRLFIVATSKFDQGKIDKWIMNKRTLLPKRCQIITLNSMVEFLNEFRPNQLSY